MNKVLLFCIALLVCCKLIRGQLLSKTCKPADFRVIQYIPTNTTETHYERTSCSTSTLVEVHYRRQPVTVTNFETVEKNVEMVRTNFFTVTRYISSIIQNAITVTQTVQQRGVTSTMPASISTQLLTMTVREKVTLTSEKVVEGAQGTSYTTTVMQQVTVERPVTAERPITAERFVTVEKGTTQMFTVTAPCTQAAITQPIQVESTAIAAQTPQPQPAIAGTTQIQSAAVVETPQPQAAVAGTTQIQSAAVAETPQPQAVVAGTTQIQSAAVVETPQPQATAAGTTQIQSAAVETPQPQPAAVEAPPGSMIQVNTLTFGGGATTLTATLPCGCATATNEQGESTVITTVRMSCTHHVENGSIVATTLSSSVAEAHEMLAKWSPLPAPAEAAATLAATPPPGKQIHYDTLTAEGGKVTTITETLPCGCTSGIDKDGSTITVTTQKIGCTHKFEHGTIKRVTSSKKVSGCEKSLSMIKKPVSRATSKEAKEGKKEERKGGKEDEEKGKKEEKGKAEKKVKEEKKVKKVVKGKDKKEEKAKDEKAKGEEKDKGKAEGKEKEKKEEGKEKGKAEEGKEKGGKEEEGKEKGKAEEGKGGKRRGDKRKRQTRWRRGQRRGQN